MIDANKYTLSIPLIKAAMNDKTDDERYLAISTLAVDTYMPAIAVTAWIGMLYGFTPKLDNLLQVLMNFYHEDSVIIGDRKINLEIAE